MDANHTATWKYVVIPTVIVLFLAIYPQLNLWIANGNTTQDTYFVSNYDEVAYSAYINSLINGHPRKNDPFIKGDAAGESLYSIQFVPAYGIALPARFLGLSSSTAFVILNFLFAIFSALAVFAFIRSVTGNNLFAAVGVLSVLCLGTAIAFQGELRHWIVGSVAVDFFPFIRRYQPGFAFPLFFLFCFSIWKLFTAAGKKNTFLYTIVSGVLLVILVFSYFYLWTTAIAWLACFTILWLWAQKAGRLSIAARVGVVGLFGLAALIPYVFMLSGRSQNMDDVQLLTLTRDPNLLTVPEIIGFILIAALIYFIRKGKLEFASPQVLLCLSILVTPFILFNQQIVTGRSLQPFHYEIFIANYLLLTAVILFIWLVKQAYKTEAFALRLRRGLIYLGVLAAIWGSVESTATARRYAGFEDLRNDAMPALKFLREQETTHFANGKPPTVMSTNLMVADYIPSATSYRSLWTPHTNSAGGVSNDENKELFFRYVYYSGFKEKELAKALDDNLFEVMSALFGGGRALSALDGDAKPVTRREMDAELRTYKKFSAEFDRSKAAEPELSYIVVPAAAEPNFQNIDQWYQRGEGQVFGLFTVYKLELKP